MKSESEKRKEQEGLCRARALVGNVAAQVAAAQNAAEPQLVFYKPSQIIFFLFSFQVVFL